MLRKVAPKKVMKPSATAIRVLEKRPKSPTGMPHIRVVPGALPGRGNGPDLLAEIADIEEEGSQLEYQDGAHRTDRATAGGRGGAAGAGDAGGQRHLLCDFRRPQTAAGRAGAGHRSRAEGGGGGAEASSLLFCAADDL